LSSLPSIFQRLQGIAALADAGHHDIAVRKLEEMPMYVRAPYIAVLFLLAGIDCLTGKHGASKHE
jgi:hypothetical protein